MNGITLSTNELSRTRLRSVSKEINNNDKDTTPEFLKTTLKSPTQRLQENMQNGTTHKKPPVLNKPGTLPRKPPSDDELKVKPPEEKKNQDQMAVEEDKRKLFSPGSVRSSRLLFEQDNQHSPPKPAPKKKPELKNKGNADNVDKQKPIAPYTAQKPQQPQQQQELIEEDNYDDVALSKPNINGYPQQRQQQFTSTTASRPPVTQPTQLPQPSGLITEDFYDDVENTSTKPPQVPTTARPVMFPQPPVSVLQPTEQEPIEEDFYNDVAAVAQTQQRKQEVSQQQPPSVPITRRPTTNIVNPPNLPSPIVPNTPRPVATLEQDDIYDDVQNPAQPQIRQQQQQQQFKLPQQGFPPSPIVPTTPRPMSNLQQDDIYDDVENSGQPQHQQQQQFKLPQQAFHSPSAPSAPRPTSMLQQDDIYDDVQIPGQPQNQKQQIPQEEEFYNDVAPPLPQTTPSLSLPPRQPNIPNISPSIVAEQAPIIEEKSFPNLSNDRFDVPTGLQQWLDDVIISNKYRLKTLTPIQGLDNVTSDNQGAAGISEKEKKKRKKEQEAIQKQEQQRKKQRLKELKYFGIMKEEDMVILGDLNCSTDYTPKEARHVSYQAGEDVQQIEVKKNNVPGKIVVRNKKGEIGYVLKVDFGMEEPIEPAPVVTKPSTEKQRESKKKTGLFKSLKSDKSSQNNTMPKKQSNSVEMIPTEDSELYDEIGGSLPPPIPATPRPNISAPPQPEDQEQIYESI